MGRRSRAVAIAAAAPAKVLLSAAVWLSLFAYAGRPILTAAAAGGVAPALAWAAIVALSAVPLLGFFAGGKRLALQWLAWMTAGLFGVLLGLVALGDLLRLGWGLLDLALRADLAPFPDARTFGVGTLAAALVLSAVGFFQARCPRVRRVAVPIRGLAPELDGYRIVQWSDVHVGPTIGRRFVESLVERTNELEPDAIAITGDLVDGQASDLASALEPLLDLHPRDGVFYVTGNHEYYWGADQWEEALERLGVHVLRNRHRTARPGLAIAGVTDPMGRGAHRPDLRAAVGRIPAGTTTVLLSHRPQTAAAASRAGVSLQLSGHTHGGQFFPFSLFIRWFQPIVAGLHRVGATWLYVNRGTGYWGPPSRLGVGGEITVIELRSE